MSGLLQTEVRTLDRLNDDVLWPCSPAPKSPLPQPRNRDVSTGRPGKPPPRRQASLGDVLGVEAAATSPSSHGVQPKARAGTPVIVEITGSRLAPDTQRLKRTVPGGREESPRQLLHDPAPRPGCQGCTVPGAWPWRAGARHPQSILPQTLGTGCQHLEAAARLPGPQGSRDPLRAAQEAQPGLGAARQLGRHTALSNAALVLGLLRPTAAQVAAGLAVTRWTGKAALSVPPLRHQPPRGGALGPQNARARQTLSRCLRLVSV